VLRGAGTYGNADRPAPPHDVGVDAANAVRGVWRQVTARQSAPPATVTAALGFLALVLLLAPKVSRVVGYVGLIAHEGGHVLAAVLAGGQIRAVHLNANGSGRAFTDGPGRFLTVAAGYTGPGLFGAGAAWLLAAGHAAGLLWAFLIMLVLMLVRVRNWFGLLPTLGSIGCVFAAVSWFSDDFKSGFACLVTWILLLSGPRDVIELYIGRRLRGWAGTDADTLADLTGVMGTFWVAVFLAVDIAVLVLGACWLL
jgi:hypothetical protein